MDPLSHVALGRMLLRSHLREHWSRGLGWAVGLGALATDIDAVLMPFAFDRYLIEHERLTHGLLGALICSVILAAVIKRFKRDVRFRELVIGSLVGSLSHLAADLVAGGTIRPLWPVSDVALFDLGLVAMGDPWVIAIFLAGMLAARLRSPRAGVISAMIVVAILGAFFVFKATMRARAARTFAQADVRVPGPAQATEPLWGSLTVWRLYMAADNDMRVYEVDGWSGRVSAVLQTPRKYAHTVEAAQAIRASRAWETVLNFHKVHHLGLVRYRRAADGSARVLWSDLRYCWHAEHSDSPSRFMPGIVCGLWFGGEVDASGSLQRELVLIGEHEQVR